MDTFTPRSALGGGTRPCPVTGRFSFDEISNAIVDGENPFGFAYAGIEEEDADGAIFGYDVAELDG